MNEIIKLIKLTYSDDENTIGIINKMIKCFDLDNKIHSVDHELNNYNFQQYVYVTPTYPRPRVEHEIQVGYEILIDDNWKTITFNNIDTRGFYD